MRRDTCATRFPFFEAETVAASLMKREKQEVEATGKYSALSGDSEISIAEFTVQAPY